MDLQLRGRFNLKELLGEHSLLWDKYCGISIGNDDIVYLLYQKASTKTGAYCYCAAALLFDWWNGELLGCDLISLGTHKADFHYLQPLGQDYLLVCARASSNGKNAVVVDRYGNEILRFAVGDAVNNCLVDSQNKIAIGYFDEGIFGDPISASGVKLWDAHGNVLWENRHYDICDCYALNLDSRDRIWFHYYQDFDIVCTDCADPTRDRIIKSAVRGFSGFLIAGKQYGLLLDKGYRAHRAFCWQTLYSTNAKAEDCRLLYASEAIPPIHDYTFRGEKGFFIDSGGNAYILSIE